jgi:N utilization substance protein B
MSKKRRVIRTKALEVLYAHQIAKEHIDKVKKDLLTEIEDNEDYEFASNLVDAVLKHQRALDLMIRNRITNWDYDRVALIDKIVMRICIAEFLYFPEIPPKVSINEALEISKMYCTQKTPNFINGILDGLLTELKKQGKLGKTGRGLIEFNKTEDEK